MTATPGGTDGTPLNFSKHHNAIRRWPPAHKGMHLCVGVASQKRPRCFMFDCLLMCTHLQQTTTTTKHQTLLSPTSPSHPHHQSINTHALVTCTPGKPPHTSVATLTCRAAAAAAAAASCCCSSWCTSAPLAPVNRLNWLSSSDMRPSATPSLAWAGGKRCHKGTYTQGQRTHFRLSLGLQAVRQCRV